MVNPPKKKSRQPTSNHQPAPPSPGVVLLPSSRCRMACRATEPFTFRRSLTTEGVISLACQGMLRDACCPLSPLTLGPWNHRSFNKLDRPWESPSASCRRWPRLMHKTNKTTNIPQPQTPDGHHQQTLSNMTRLASFSLTCE